MEPLGTFAEAFAPAVVCVVGAIAAVSATALFELSRTLAETYKGRWFAGNGRDIFHALAICVLWAGLVGAGFPAPMGALAAALVSSLPLLLLDDLPPRRPVRVALLFTMIVLGLAPALLEPRSVADALNAMARALFH